MILRAVLVSLIETAAEFAWARETQLAKSKGTSDLQRQSGLQTVQRAASVLRALSERGMDGMRLSEVASLTELHKATAFRVLSALIREGFVEQDPMKGYHLGAATWILGMAAAPRFDIRKLAARALDRIAEASGDTVFLSMRSGLEAVCIDRREGSFPIRTLTLDVGSRRPLGVGAGSLALLAFLPDEEVRQIMAANQKALRRYPRFTCDEINDLVARARARGYSFNDGRIIPGMSAVGVPVFDHLGRPTVALSCAAITDRMGPGRQAKIVSLLLKEAKTIARQLNPQSPEPSLPSTARMPNKLPLTIEG